VFFAEERISIAIGEWPPFISENLKHYGVVPRIVTEAFALGNVKVDYGFFPWKRAMEYANEGDWDGSAVWGYTSERGKTLLYSDPVRTEKYQII